MSCRNRLQLAVVLCAFVTVTPQSGAAEANDPCAGADWVKDMRAYSYGWADDACGSEQWKTPAEYLADANEIAANGFNSIVLWGRHFRFGYIEEWPAIVAELNELTAAFHEYGIKVFDHHSAAYVDANDISLPLPGGGTMRDLLEIDANSGEPVYVPGYDAYVVCPNKRASQLLYNGHVTDLFTQTGLDGLMSDDVYFEAWSCVCDSCKAKCLADWGLDVNEYLPVDQNNIESFWGLPGSGGNAENPDWRRWVRFRLDSVGRHYERVRAVMDANRPQARLMGCMCEFVEPWGSYVNGTNLDQIARGANILFFEAFSNSGKSYFVEWPHDAEQFVRGQSIGRPSSRPVLPLQYADAVYEELLFTWAFDKTFGCRVWTTRLEDKPEFLAGLGPILRWEQEHKELFREPAPPANIAILYSTQSRDSVRAHGFWGSEEHGMGPDYRGWCEPLLRANIPFHVIVEDQLTAEGLAPYRVLILPSVTCLSDKQCVEIAAWTAAGGSLIATADCAMFDATGEHRAQGGLAEVLGVDIGAQLECNSPVVVPDEDVFAGCGGQIDEPVRQRYACYPRPGTVSFGLIEEDANTPAMVRNVFGLGDSVYLGFRLGAAAWTRTGQCDSNCSDPRLYYKWFGPKTPCAWNVVRNLVAPARSGLAIVVEPNAPEGLMVTLHKLTDGRRVVHALNATAAVIEPVGAFVEIPKHYAEFPPITTDTTIKLREPIAVPVVAHLPDGNDVVLDANIYDGSFVLPGSAAGFYTAIEMGPVPAVADFNHDGSVDLLDLKILAAYWLFPCVDVQCAECNLYANDGFINFPDFAVFASYWRQ